MNYKHLYYFWATAHAGGVMRAGEQLHTTPQTPLSQGRPERLALACAANLAALRDEEPES